MARKLLIAVLAVFASFSSVAAAPLELAASCNPCRQCCPQNEA